MLLEKLAAVHVSCQWYRHFIAGLPVYLPSASPHWMQQHILATAAGPKPWPHLILLGSAFTWPSSRNSSLCFHLCQTKNGAAGLHMKAFLFCWDFRGDLRSHLLSYIFFHWIAKPFFPSCFFLLQRAWFADFPSTLSSTQYAELLKSFSVHSPIVYLLLRIIFEFIIFLR